MRKLLVLTLFALMSVLSAHAYDFEVDGIYYQISYGTYDQVEVTYQEAPWNVTERSDYSGSVVIPSTVTYYGDTYAVTSIGYYAFRDCSGLTSVTIPESVTSIGEYAFGECSGLTSVTIPESVTSIWDDAFRGCSGLTSVTIPESVTYIGYNAFYQCSLTSVEWNAVACRGFTYTAEQDPKYVFPFYDCGHITSITFGNQVEHIPDYLCCNQRGLTSITIPESVTYIGYGAFSGCSGLTSVYYTGNLVQWCGIEFGSRWVNNDWALYINNVKVKDLLIPDGVTSIGSSAFSGCSGLTSVTIPESVSTIGSSAFSGCSGLPTVTIPESVTSIGSSAFSGCSGLTSVTIPESVTIIEEKAFSGCSGLPTVTIPESVTSIGSAAFADCSGLTSVTIPEGVTSIGSAAFSGCSGLTSVEWNAVDCSTPYYFDEYKPSFYNCENIMSITFGNQVKRIPAYLCYGKNKITSVTIPDSVTTIEENAFSGCSGLTSVTIPESVTTIEENAFSGCSGLTSVTIPESVTTIGKKAFDGCSGLTSVKSLAETPPSCDEDIFGDDDYYTMPLYVPAGSKPFYTVAQGWRKFAKIEEFEANIYTVTVLANDASMGAVTGGGEYKDGEQAMLAAIPYVGYYFARWSDGNTNNPRILAVTKDTTVTAIFAKNGEEPTANENAEADNFRVYVQNRTIHLSEDRGSVQVYNIAGQCIYNGHATAIPVQQSGVYIVVAGARRCKVLVK